MLTCTQIKIIKQTEPDSHQRGYVVFDPGDILTIVPTPYDNPFDCTVSVGRARFLIRNGFAEYLKWEPTSIEGGQDAVEQTS